MTAAFVCAESDGIEKYHIKVVKECVQKEYSAKTMNKIDTQLSQPAQMAFCLVEAAAVRTAAWLSASRRTSSVRPSAWVSSENVV